MNKIVKKEVESSLEYILPDYMGDIKKILYSRAWCIPGGKYVSGAEAEHSGVVEYEVLYADSENRLTAVTASSDYTVTVSAGDVDLRDSYHKCKVAGATVRTTGPRKLSFKSMVESSILVVSDSDGEEKLCDGLDGDNIQKSTAVIKKEVCEYIATAEREIAEEIGRVNGVAKDDIEIVLSSAEVRITETRASDKGILIKGELIVEMVKRVADAPPYSAKKAYPFEHTVTAELADNVKLTAVGTPSSITVGMSEDGEDTVLALNAIVEVGLWGIYNQDNTVVVDAYSTEYESDNSYSNLEYTTLNDLVCTEFCLDEKVEKGALGLTNVRDILIARAEAVCFGCEGEHRNIKINGEMRISGVACEINEDDEIVYTPFKHSFPFSYNVNSNCQIGDNDSLECELKSVLADISIDSESLYFKAAVNACVKVSAKKSVKYLSACRMCDGAVVQPSGSRITVYYPNASETLFDIAKKHHTTCEKLCLDNSIAIESSSASAQQLPKKLIIK